MFLGLALLLRGIFLFGYLTGGNSFPKPLSADEEQKYLRAYANGDEDAKNILVERNLRLVAHVVKKYGNHNKENEDMISVGTIGLIKAITSYRPDKGTRLATYAARCIDNAMLTRRGREVKRERFLELYVIPLQTL
ncbi:MAG: flagellar biosynthesis protein FliA [Clostridiales bacterium]|nr:flagellar biosynthesis protein FliA [Clostridiales bacterium]